MINNEEPIESVDCVRAELILVTDNIINKKPFCVRIVGWRKKLLRKTLPVFIKIMDGEVKKDILFRFSKFINPFFWSIIDWAVREKFSFTFYDVDGDLLLYARPSATPKKD